MRRGVYERREKCELRYDEDYAVEIGNHVEVDMGEVHRFDGQVTKIHEKAGEVSVWYLDSLNCRRDGEPIKRRARLALDKVDLIARDS